MFIAWGVVLHIWGQSYLHKFLGNLIHGDLSILPYLFIELFIYISMDSDIYFILWNILLYFVVQFFSPLATGSSFKWLLWPFDPQTSVVLLCLFVCFTLLFEHSLLFSTTSYSRLTLYIPFPTLEPAISLRNPDDFYWKMVFKTKIWAPSMLITTRVSLLQGPLS